MYFPFPEKRNLSEKVVIVPYFASYFQEQYSNRERVFNCSKLTSYRNIKSVVLALLCFEQNIFTLCKPKVLKLSEIVSVFIEVTEFSCYVNNWIQSFEIFSVLVDMI